MFGVLEFKLVDILGFLAMMGIVFGAFGAWGQTDFKRLVAYSSVNHMGFVVLGLAVAALAYGTMWAEHNRQTSLLAGVAGVDVEEYRGTTRAKRSIRFIRRRPAKWTVRTRGRRWAGRCCKCLITG